MRLRRILVNLANVIAHEAEKNPVFLSNIENALGISEREPGKKAAKEGRKNGAQLELNNDAPAASDRRAGNRRAPAAVDPVQLARESESHLRAALGALNLEQLRDIVAEYGMDTGGLVMKWKKPERVIERIVEIAMQRAQKGHAFRDQDETPKFGLP